MLRFILKRLLHFIPVILLITMIIFAIVELMPGDIINAYLGQGKPLGRGKPTTDNGNMASMEPSTPYPTMNTEEYGHIEESGFKDTLNNPLSTFSIDIDTASYSNIRRFIMDGKLPPKDAVRIEEMINYFSYDYPNSKGDIPISTIVEIGEAPWNEKHNLVMIGLKGKEIETDISQKNNLVF